jgi:transcriptional regulator with XRE-family HTH domain
LTQEQIATELGTTKSNISRLESLNNTYSPNLTTLIKYADVLDMQLEVDLV